MTRLERVRQFVVEHAAHSAATLNDPEYGGTEVDYWADAIVALIDAEMEHADGQTL
jgi:hypothetical protein